MICQGSTKSRIQRNLKSKWFVTHQELKGTYYHPYCSTNKHTRTVAVGYAVFISSDLIMNMVNSIYKIDYFCIDDYFLTGLLAKEAQAKHIMLNTKFAFFNNTLTKIFRKNSLEKMMY